MRAGWDEAAFEVWLTQHRLGPKHTPRRSCREMTGSCQPVPEPSDDPVIAPRVVRIGAAANELQRPYLPLAVRGKLSYKAAIMP